MKRPLPHSFAAILLPRRTRCPAAKGGLPGRLQDLVADALKRRATGAPLSAEMTAQYRQILSTYPGLF
ncbi:MAG: hypothetical protein ABJF23_03145 [Bryobacteraceae bacterium]